MRSAYAGGKIAFSSDGILFSTNFTAGLPQDPAGGLHAVTFRTVSFVGDVPPILSTLKDPTNETTERTNVVKFSITPRIFPLNVKVQDTATIDFKQNGIPQSNLSRTFNPNTQTSLDFDAGTFKSPAKDLTATVTFTTLAGNKIVSREQPVTFGIVKILVDLNNDTVVDNNDEAIRVQNMTKAAADKKRFSFWESDSSKLNLSSTPSGDPGIPTLLSSNAQEDALQDYATIKIHAEALPPANYILGFKLEGATWALTDKAPGPASCSGPSCNSVDVTQLTRSKEHLSDGPTAQIQLGLINGNAKLCHNVSDPTAAPGECVSDSSGMLTIDSLPLGDTVALFRCISCRMTDLDAAGNGLDGNRGLIAQLVPTSGSPVALDRVDADIRPFHNWAGAWSARTPDDSAPTDLVKEKDWTNAPQNAAITIVVHGFSVSEDDALNRFIPSYGKRLYWVGHPILQAQQASPTSKVPFFMGVTWHGDHRTGEKAFAPTVLTSLFFPDDVRFALISGPALATFIKQRRGEGSDIKVIAHSLGNGFVNSALLDLNSGDISTYIMNEAAVPAEAFDPGFFELTDTNGGGLTSNAIASETSFMAPFLAAVYPNLLNQHLIQMGFSNDQIWDDQLTEILNQVPGCTVDPFLRVCNDREQFDESYLPGQPVGQATAAETDANKNDFRSRWHSFGAGGTPTPWLGYFAGNTSKTTIINSFNRGDCALVHAWSISQLTQEPDRPLISSLIALDYAMGHPSDPFPAALREDNIGNELWLTFGSKQDRLSGWYPARSAAVGDYPYEPIFGQAGVLDFTPPGESRCSNQTQYVPITSAAGLAQTIINPTSTTITDLTSIGSLFTSFDTHTYMTSVPFSKDWQHFQDFAAKLKGN